MKFRMILTALLLPAVVLAQQPGEKRQNRAACRHERIRDYSRLTPCQRPDTLMPGNLSTFAEQSKVRVNLNLRNAPLKEAIKQLSEQTK